MAQSIFIVPNLSPIIPYPVTFPAGSAAAPSINFAGDTTFGLWAEGTGILSLSRTTHPTVFRVYNTYTSSVNNERFAIDWQTTANVCLIGTRTAATGTGRTLSLISQSSSAGTFMTLALSRQTAPFMQFGLTADGITFSGTNTTSSHDTAGLVCFGPFGNTATSGQVNFIAILPTYNQASGTAANTDLLINRTETAVGSGAQNLIDLQVATVSKFRIDNAGRLWSGATGGFSGTVTPVTAITVVNGIVTAVS